jgi:CheY-like chemotaxis protein
MAVSFFGGPSGSGGRVWSASKLVGENLDQKQLLGRIRELESLCTEVLVAGVDLGLPQRLLNQLWGAVGNGELPHAFNVDLPPAPPKPIAPAAPASTAPAAAASPFVAPAAPATASVSPETEPSLPDAATRAAALMPIPDIPLSTNPLTAPNQDQSRPRPPQAELKPLGAKKTVVVVDDDPMMLDVLARILQRENFELLMASGGPEIIQKLGDHHGAVDLLVTDYAMPDMQGRELADHVRQRFPAIKVLYQTGFSDMLFGDRVELEEGAAFLEKPFTARGLREAARLVLFGSINP